VTERNYGREAHEAAERHLEDCFEALEQEEEVGAENVIWPDVDAPFCGCLTCVTREVLHAGWPAMLDGAREVVAREIEKIRDEVEVSGEWSLSEVAALVRGGWANSL
jgi:hypothetical protein